MKDQIAIKVIDLIEKSAGKNITSRSIAAHCKINQAMIYYYFGSKTALLDKAIKTTVQNAFLPLILEIKSNKLPPTELINFVVNDLLVGMKNYPNISKYHFKTLYEENKLNYATKKYFELFKELENSLAQNLAKPKQKKLEEELKLLKINLISIAVFPSVAEGVDAKLLTKNISQLFN